MNIIYFDWHSSASEYYRAMPLDYLNSGHLQVTRSTEREINSHTINPYDIVIVFRPSSSFHLNLVKLAQDMGRKVIIDWDDNPMCLPKENPMHDHYEGEKKTTVNCLALADEIWVSTEAIKQSFLPHNPNIHVIPNAHNDCIFPVDKKMPFGKKKRIMWRGGQSHMGDIYQPGTTEWIVRNINSNKKWDFYWLGQKFEFIEYRVKHKNFFHHPGGPAIQFFKMMQDINPEIFFYPLTTNLFNESKSNCSWLEATYAGAAYFGNKKLPEFDKDCILPLEHLSKMLKDDNFELLEQKNKESWELICNDFLLSKVNEYRKNRLIEITQ